LTSLVLSRTSCFGEDISRLLFVGVGVHTT